MATETGAVETVLVCGSRKWSDTEAIKCVLDELPFATMVIHGNAPGADKIAEREAMMLGHNTIAYPADWVRYGRAAGPMRNAQMLRDGKPDLVIAFRLDGPSPGTDDMIRQAKKAGVPVRVITDSALLAQEKAD